MSAPLCLHGCGQPRQPHPNARYCLRCRRDRRHHPQSTLTDTQAVELIRLRGTMPRHVIAQQLGVSTASVNRWLRDHGVTSNSQRLDPSLVDAVLATYVAVGRPETERRYPGVRIDSIVERYPHAPRQVRWTAHQQIEAARMAGLVTPNAQARYFGRPNAYSGSIKALWAKWFQCEPRHIHGLPAHLAWPIVQVGTPALLLIHEKGGQHAPRVLWLTIHAHLRPDVDPVIRRAIAVLAQFQAWLQGTTDVTTIVEMIREREESDGSTREWPSTDADPGDPRTGPAECGGRHPDVGTPDDGGDQGGSHVTDRQRRV